MDQPLAAFGAVAGGGTPAIAEAPATGWLRLDVEPAQALQLFVDDEYVGTGDDLGGELRLGAGTRRLELRAPGHKSLVLNVRIAGGQTTTYRGVLEPIASEPSPMESSRQSEPASTATQPSPKPRQTFYFIPGCYLGNVPPSEVKLPADCDLSRLVTRTP